MTQQTNDLALLILAAGKGTRMKSALPKVLHPIAGKPIVHHALDVQKALNPAKTIVVTGHDAEAVEANIAKAYDNITFVRQTEQNGTGHAVMCCKEALDGFTGTVVILYGDVLLGAQPGALEALLKFHEEKSHVLTCLTALTNQPQGLGRILRNPETKNIIGNVEEKDANPEQKQIQEANSGIMAISGKHLYSLLEKTSTENAQGEYYLTDLIHLAHTENLRLGALAVQADRCLLGANNRAEFANLERFYQVRYRNEAMLNGATLIDPNSVIFSHDTTLGQDVTVWPNVVFRSGVSVGNGSTIFENSSLEQAKISENNEIGPFARLRGGVETAENVAIGNFVEVKKSTIGANSKAKHLSYLGDAVLGKDVNIGGGTLTANYNTKTREKLITNFQDDVKVGAGSILVAPVTMHTKSYSGAGSVIRSDVPQNALAVSKHEDLVKEGYNK